MGIEQSKEQVQKEQNISPFLEQRYQKQKDQEKLNLDKCNNQWVEAIKSNNWQMLTQLSICQSEIKDDQLVNITERKWKRLRKLRLEWNQITKIGINYLVPCQFLSLRILNVGNFGGNAGKNNIGNSGAKWIVKMNIPFIQILDLSQCNISNEGAKHLSKGYWKHLKKFNLRSNYISLDGYSILIEGNWPLSASISSLTLNINNKTLTENNSIALLVFFTSKFVILTSLLLLSSIFKNALLEDIKKIFKQKY